MRTLFLHIGFHKTGSSSIQLSLERQKETLIEHGWQFLSDNKSGNSSACISVKNRHTWVEYKIQSHFYDLLDTAKENNVIISAEHLCFITDPSELKRLYNYLSVRFDSIKVIGFLRRQDKLAKSFKDQAAKTITYKSNAASILCGHSPEPLPELTPPIIEYFDYHSKVKLWSDIFNKDNLYISDFDDAVKHENGICSFFSEIINLPFLLPEIKVNESVNKETSAIWHLLCQIGLGSEDLNLLRERTKTNRKDEKYYIEGSKEFLGFFTDSNKKLHYFLNSEFEFSNKFLSKKENKSQVNKAKLANAFKESRKNNENDLIEILKEFSIYFEKKSQYNLAFELIKIAKKLRKNGPFIEQQYDFLNKLLLDEKNNRFILSENERINYYFKARFKSKKKLGSKMIFDQPFLYVKGQYSDIPNNYIKDIEEILASFPEKTKIPVQLGDKMSLSGDNVFCKSRVIGDSSSILLKINKKRHFGLDTKLYDFSWENKKSTPVWRGATTGHDNLRENFIAKYHSIYNVGFSQLTQNKKINSAFWKPKLTIAEQLKFKYIVSLEGNDVASNLKWILSSNSVPIMSKPTKECWAMEGLLEPYIHYLPLNDSLSNLDEMVDWAIENDDLCKEIAFNGKVFMSQFYDEGKEMDLQIKIINIYNKL